MEILDHKFEKEPVEIGEGIYWVGYSDGHAGLHCNPYLIVEKDEAVLIDGGSRDDFSNVMLKILRTGLEPARISRLIYQHYDPDLCGSLPQLESLIDHDGLRIISQGDNNAFIHYYSAKTPKIDFRDIGSHFDFATGRRLEFYATPFCHQVGSFVTYDTKTKTLFSSDLFGSCDDRWTLFLKLEDACRECVDTRVCLHNIPVCPLKSIKQFHQRVMTSNMAAANTLNTIEALDIECIAPQHGNIIVSKTDVRCILRYLRTIENVGIEHLLLGEEL